MGIFKQAGLRKLKNRRGGGKKCNLLLPCSQNENGREQDPADEGNKTHGCLSSFFSVSSTIAPSLKCSHYRKHQNSATKQHHRKHVRFRPKIKQKKPATNTSSRKSENIASTRPPLQPLALLKHFKTLTFPATSKKHVKPLSTEMFTIQECVLSF